MTITSNSNFSNAFHENGSKQENVSDQAHPLSASLTPNSTRLDSELIRRRAQYFQWSRKYRFLFDMKVESKV